MLLAPENRPDYVLTAVRHNMCGRIYGALIMTVCPGIVVITRLPFRSTEARTAEHAVP